MDVVRFRTADIAREHRFAAWHEMASQALIPTGVATDNTADFAAAITMFDLGAIQISMLAYPPLRATRTARNVRQSDPELYYLTLPVCGWLGVSHAGRQAEVDPRHLVVIDTSQPGVVVNAEPVRHIIVQVRRGDLPLRPAVLDRVLGQRLTASRGTGALLKTVVREIAHSAADYRPADRARLAMVVVDLVVAVLAGHVDNEGSVRDARHRLLRTRILDFIDGRLADPTLTPTTIAAAHHISLRYLHLLFHEQGDTVAGWIRNRRLERCRHDLLDDALVGRPASVIGAGWGYADATAFSRAFKRAFGTSPGDYRRQMLRP